MVPKVGRHNIVLFCFASKESTDIIDGNLKLILGMIWTLILRFTIADIRSVFILLALVPSLVLPCIGVKARKVFLLRRVYSFGVSVRRHLIRK